mmetsp:Transcript_16112/g.19056  ORF Transcript_16112/g.19056 Transcript_16112/m.19056 type:complete len:281 (+) Transcript_16112:302-1144(+)
MHILLAQAANGAQVLTCGELEVNEDGVLTRWTNRGVFNEMPPALIIHQLRLPYERAWVHITGEQLSTKFDSIQRKYLIEQGLLVNLSTAQTPPPTTTPTLANEERNRTTEEAPMWMIKYDTSFCGHLCMFHSFGIITKDVVLRMLNRCQKKCCALVGDSRESPNDMDPQKIELALRQANNCQTYANSTHQVRRSLEKQVSSLDDDDDDENKSRSKNRERTIVVSTIPNENDGDLNHSPTPNSVMIFDWTEDEIEDEYRVEERVNEMKRHLKLVGLYQEAK